MIMISRTKPRKKTQYKVGSQLDNKKTFCNVQKYSI